jgi:hypothetical protein
MTNQMVREAFTKGQDYKWMICEDGGIYEGPSGKHSERIGELKIGEMIKADAETFDPDNKIIWRLKEPLEGGWMYAPVRGPKTAVPMNAETIEAYDKGTRYYKVGGKKGTIVREGKEMDSDKVKIIESGTVVAVEETVTLEDSGKERLRISDPCEGWVTKTQVEIWYKELSRAELAKIKN